MEIIRAVVTAVADTQVKRRHRTTRHRDHHPRTRAEIGPSIAQQLRWIVDVLENLRADRVSGPSGQSEHRRSIIDEVDVDQPGRRELAAGDLVAACTGLQTYELSLRPTTRRCQQEVSLPAADVNQTPGSAAPLQQPQQETPTVGLSRIALSRDRVIIPVRIPIVIVRAHNDIVARRSARRTDSYVGLRLMRRLC